MQRLRYLVTVPYFYAMEVVAYLVGAALMFGLACIAVLLVACAVAGFTAQALREEAGYLWRTLRSRRTDRAGR